MIKSILKIFVKNLVYIFISMGIIYLSLIVAFYYFITSTANNLTICVNDVLALINQSVEASEVSVNEYLSYAFAQINWDGNFFDTISEILQTDWIVNTLTGFLETLDISLEGFGEKFAEIIDVFAGAMTTNIIICMVAFGTGILCANFATKFAIRNRSAKRNLKQTVLSHTVVPFVQGAIIIAFMLLLPIIRLFSFLLIFVLLILLGFMSLFGAWIIHKDAHLRLKEVVRIDNILLYSVAVFIIVLLNLVLALLLFKVNSFFALLIMLPFVVYSLNIIDINSEAFVCSLLETRNKPDILPQGAVAENAAADRADEQPQ